VSCAASCCVETTSRSYRTASLYGLTVVEEKNAATQDALPRTSAPSQTFVASEFALDQRLWCFVHVREATRFDRARSTRTMSSSTKELLLNGFSENGVAGEKAISRPNEQGSTNLSVTRGN